LNAPPPNEGAVVRRYDPDVKSEAERLAAASIVDCVFIYDRVDHDSRPMTFLPNGTIGFGAAGRELFWDLRQEGDRLVLDIASKTEVTCSLVHSETGQWEGRWFHAEQMPIVLRLSTPVYLEAPAHRARDGSLEENVTIASAVKLAEGSGFTRAYEIRVFSQEYSDFTRVRDSRVLIYFRHGFGDWATLSYILPLLDQSNRYWITRFGDDYTSVMENSRFVTPLYLGSNSIMCDDGGLYSNRHFGIDLGSMDGTCKVVNLPLSLYDACAENGISALLHLSYPEVHGLSRYPFHTKARYMLPYLVARGRLDMDALKQPLTTAIDFTVEPWIANWVSSRLRNFGGFGDRKLCIISRNGYSVLGKNWGHKWREDLAPGKRREGEECRDFMRLMLRKDPHWMFLVMEDIMFQGDDTLRSEELHAYSFAELFGAVGAAFFPFGIVIKALLNMAHLSIGVPTGPYHLSMVKCELPTVGVWLEHLPCWYDEPRPNSMHLISRDVLDRGLDRRFGSFTDRGGLHFPTRRVDTRIITGEQVFEAVEAVLARG
jgi:hypothetical protein